MGEVASERGSEGSSVGFWRVMRLILASVWRRFRWLLLLAVVLALVSGLMAALVPKLLQQIIDLLIKDPRAPAASLRSLVLLMAGAAFVGVLAGFATSKITFYIATQIEDHWRFKALGHYYTLPLQWHDSQDSGQVGGRIDRGGSAIYSIINDVLGHNFFIAFTTLSVVLVAALLAAPDFWWIFLLPIPLYVLFTYYLGNQLSRHQETLNSLADDAGRTLYDGLSNVRSVKAFGMEREEARRYETRWTEFHKYEYSIETLIFTRTAVQSLLELCMRVVLILFSFYAISRSDMSVGTMVMLITYQGMIFGPLGQLNGMFAWIRRAARRGSGLFEILEETDPLADNPGAQDLDELKESITFEDVTFRYGSSAKPSLDGISCELRAGTTTALVGRSGSGKSTFALLLMRFYDPTSGAVRWDGRELRGAARASMRRRIALVPQDTSLFNRSIAENIAYGRPGATADEVIDAAKRAHAHDFIMAMPAGYDSIIGERGVKLSGGQRQRIAIARALLTGPSLLILDESTSHLDSENEDAIQDSITSLHHKTTQVIVAHRLSTVLHADQILVMEKGRIVACGRHDELLATSEIYRRLYELQFRKREPQVPAQT